MSEAERPQITLVTPPEVDLAAFRPRLVACLDAVPVACLRLALAGHDEDRIARIADALREEAHGRDIAVVLDRHVMLAARLGLDGVHLTDGARSVRKVRKELGDDAIVGTHCGASRHDGMTAAELGADYVMFGPAGPTALGTGDRAGRELFAWWSEMIEVPVVAEGALDAATLADLAPVTDFVALGEELWGADDAAGTLRELARALG